MTDKPDYMQKARDEYETADIITGQSAFDRLMGSLARTLEVLDTERAAHEATKAESLKWQDRHDHQLERAVQAEAEWQALREAAYDVMHVLDQTTMRGIDLGGRIERLRSLLPAPEPDPLPRKVRDALRKAFPFSLGEADEGNAADMIDALTRHGLTITTIGNTP